MYLQTIETYYIHTCTCTYIHVPTNHRNILYTYMYMYIHTYIHDCTLSVNWLCNIILIVKYKIIFYAKLINKDLGNVHTC